MGQSKELSIDLKQFTLFCFVYMWRTLPRCELQTVFWDLVSGSEHYLISIVVKVWISSTKLHGVALNDLWAKKERAAVGRMNVIEAFTLFFQGHESGRVDDEKPKNTLSYLKSPVMVI